MLTPNTDISRLQQLLKWRLLAGSHKFPGPSGGTCFLEAANVVSGHPYRLVARGSDVPEDFSLVMSHYMLHLNDALPDEPRQALIRFVPRMAGSFDLVEIEEARIALIVSETRKRLLPVARRLGWQQVKGRKPQSFQWRSRLSWAARVAATPWTTRQGASVADREQAMERVLAIIDGALSIGEQVAPVEPLTALVRLETVRPQEPRRARVSVAS
jgi:hypothetical protein